MATPLKFRLSLPSQAHPYFATGGWLHACGSAYGFNSLEIRTPLKTFPPRGIIFQPISVGARSTPWRITNPANVSLFSGSGERERQTLAQAV